MKLLYVGIAIVAIILIIGSFVFVFQNQNQSQNNVQSETKETTLSVLPQTSTSSVTIDHLTLTKSGFVAIRSIEGQRLGQIVEISPYLLLGEHTNLTIELGEFYDGTSELIAVVYQDDKTDMVFNDLDQPMRDAGGEVIARYIKTGETVASVLFANTGENAPHVMGNTKMETVRYTNIGYEPSLLSVPLGTMVQFVNESDDEMWVASNEHPSHTDLPTFDQFGLSPKGSTYTYTFDEAGAWSYHDHLNPEREVMVQVI